MPRFIIFDDSTIRESRDQEDSRPRKRQRVDADLDGGNEHHVINPQSSRKDPGSLVRDPDYYLVDDATANIVIRVEDTLFKVHAHVLSCSFVIEEMLTLHHGEAGRTSDERPLELRATSVDQFRALLWALYTRPQVDVDHLLEPPNVDRLLALTTITSHLHLDTLHGWATDVLLKAVANNTFIEACSSATFTRIIDVAVESKLKDLLSIVISKWSNRIFEHSIPSVPAILAADKHSLPALRGAACYVHLQEMTDRQTTVTDRGATQLYADPKLSNTQVIRLLSGHWSLVRFWERLRHSPPKYPHAVECAPEGHRACGRVWESRWGAAAVSEQVLRCGSADTMAILSCLYDRLSVDRELMEGIAPACRAAALSAVKDVREEFLGGLADHFFGCV